MTRDAARVIKRIEALGYSFERNSNRGNLLTYKHPDGHEVSVSAGISEHSARRVLAAVEDRRGAAPAANKRNVENIKARQVRAAEQEASERARMQARTDEILAARTAALARQSSAACSADEWRAIARQIEEFDREARELRGLMSAPAPRESRARHRNGSGEVA